MAALFVALPAFAQISLDGPWAFALDQTASGEANGWASPTFDDRGWATVQSGARWEDQGFPKADGHAWYRRAVTVPESWQGKPVWFYCAGVNDACTVYCNGTRIASFGKAPDQSVAHVPLLVDLSAAIHAGAANLIALDVRDFGGSGGLWKSPCVLAADTAALPLDSFVSAGFDADGRHLSVFISGEGLGPLPAEVVAAVEALGQHAEAPLEGASRRAALHLAFDGTTPGQALALRVTFRAAGQTAPLLECAQTITVPNTPVWNGEYAGLKVRNNFVTELRTAALTERTIEFPNPRDGWVFIAVSSTAGVPAFYLDGESAPLVWRVNPDTGAHEAMRYLREGRHALRNGTPMQGKAELRAVPELAYCYYPSSPHLTPYGPYDWRFVSKHVLPHVNAIVTTGGMPREEFEAWRAEGRHWIGNALLPGLTSETPPDAEAVYKAWRDTPGAAKPGYSGIMVDEFLGAGKGHYDAWTAALKRLHAEPAFAGRTFYAWCGDIVGQTASSDFRRLIPELGHAFSWEKYLPEAATEDDAQCLIMHDLTGAMRIWRAEQPDIARRIVMCLGYLCAFPEGVNRDPSVDYHVFMDMQFQALANDPAFWNLRGLMEYSASYADEESLRWAHKLFRHYCIEGHRERLSNTPYRLDHLVNPDFAQGLEGWQVEPAAAGSIDTHTMEGYSHLHGRYPRTQQGDRFCWMKRVEGGVNLVRQTIRNLEPGRLYSLKLLASNIARLNAPDSAKVDVQLEGAKRLEPYSFVFTYPINYAHELPPYTREHPAYFTFNRIVFRPNADSVELSIADTGAVGEETAFNFVEVQPFLEP